MTHDQSECCCCAAVKLSPNIFNLIERLFFLESSMMDCCSETTLRKDIILHQASLRAMNRHEIGPYCFEKTLVISFGYDRRAHGDFHRTELNR